MSKCSILVEEGSHVVNTSMFQPYDIDYFRYVDELWHNTTHGDILWHIKHYHGDCKSFRATTTDKSPAGIRFMIDYFFKQLDEYLQVQIVGNGARGIFVRQEALLEEHSEGYAIKCRIGIVNESS